VLTKDLIKYRTYKQTITPQFIDPQNSQYQSLAKQLLTIYNPKEKPSRQQLAQTTTALINAAPDIKLAKGLNKIILDGCKFSQTIECNFPAIRKQIFQKSSTLLAQKITFKEFTQAIQETFPDQQQILKDIYADHPQNETLTTARKLYPTQLLQRYNCSLVQSLLLQSNNLTINIKEAKVAKLRRVFKYLKFFRLLAQIKYSDKRKKQIQINIDGPASIFTNTNKYALQLASFFPAICTLDRWQLTTKININKQQYTLQLDQNAKLVSHYQHFNAYIPEEITIFYKQFKQKITNWKITPNTPFLELNNANIIFPDLTFKNQNNQTIHLELFHRWHANPLIQRLQQITNKDKLMIGIDKILLKKPEIEQIYNNQTKQHIFTFRNFPSISKIKTILKQYSNPKQKI